MYGRRETLAYKFARVVDYARADADYDVARIVEMRKTRSDRLFVGHAAAFQNVFRKRDPRAVKRRSHLIARRGKGVFVSENKCFRSAELGDRLGQTAYCARSPENLFYRRAMYFSAFASFHFSSFPGVNPSVFFTVKYSTESRQSQVRNGAIIRRLCARRAKSSEIIRIVLPALPKSIRLWAVFVNNR